MPVSSCGIPRLRRGHASSHGEFDWAVLARGLGSCVFVVDRVFCRKLHRLRDSSEGFSIDGQECMGGVA